MIVSAVSHGLAFLAFAAFAAVLALGVNRRGPALFLIVACLVTAAWSVTAASAALSGQARTLPELLLETMRSVCWIAFLYRLLLSSSTKRGVPAKHLVLPPTILFFVSLLVADVLVERTDIADAWLSSYAMVARLIIPIIGLTLIENLARDDWQNAQWWARFLFIGLGGLFAYDLFVYSEALLFRRVNLELYAVRGAVDMIAVPLMAISFARNPTFAVDIHVSRRFVFHTMTLGLTGFYLLLMAVAGYYLRNFGGTWGTLLQVTFLSAAIVLVFLTLSSGTVRSALRNFVSANFFSYKYDYRHEWLQFIGLISAQESLLPLHDRVVQAIANIVDSPGGTLWVHRQEDEAFVNTAAWNAPLSREHRRLPNVLVEWFEGAGRILDIASGSGSDATAAPDLPAWVLDLQRAWIAIPLTHRHRLLGFLILTTPRAPRSLSEEDYALLTTAGRQAASYIAEEEAGRALMDARQLELFNQRFAFVVHDIKNLVSQLSLILSNAERHGDNPEFQRDLLATVGHSVARMKSLLEQLSVARRGGETKSAAFDLVPVLRREWQERAGLDPRLTLRLAATACPIEAEQETLLQVVRHVVQNGLEATSTEGHVEIALAHNGEFGLLQIIDDGVGMTAEFIRDQLFRPFKSTKTSGYGIGAYQARELIRRMGGRLEVDSTPGKGTTFSLYFPLTTSAAASSRQVQQA